ncbi:MAG: hypothetical protein KCHDKBKB_00047 [Elusimicrobia bacterium]|nr:hypothetical protein [Elusimicrobiota bacterium]
MKFALNKKSPLWPVLLSALVAPGMGQIYLRDFQKGFFLLFSSLASFFWFSKVVTEQLDRVLPGTPDQWAQNPALMQDALKQIINENSSMYLTFQILILLIWGFGVLDAYFTARSHQKSSHLSLHENENTDR